MTLAGPRWNTRGFPSAWASSVVHAGRKATGVRFGEKEWKETLDRWIAGHNEKIHAILREYGVPLLDE